MEIWRFAKKSPRQMKKLIADAKKKRSIELRLELKKNDLEESRKTHLSGSSKLAMLTLWCKVFSHAQNQVIV